MSFKSLFLILSHSKAERLKSRRFYSRLMRLTGGLMLAALIGAVSTGSAAAEDDPPSLVGRLAAIDGTVSFHTKDETTWSAATPNYPITTGNALWADSGSHAVIQLGANEVNLGPQTELDVDRLDEQVFQASLPQGTVYLNLRGLSNGDQIQIATPRGTVNINQPGRYEVFSGDQTHPSTVTVLEGAAQVAGDNNLNLPVAAGQTGVLSDNGQGGPVTANLAPSQGEDELVAWARSRETRAAPPPQEAAAMTGAQDLGNYGTWSTSPDYGNVWYPQVATGWVPYRSGHWAWVAPWGWTWVDDAPWGFAPFHYGRWVRIGPRWAWAPRPVVVVGAPIVPVYAPALVTFVGDIGGIGVSLSLGGPSVGWVPLAPREVYYPPYRVSDRYLRRVNVTYVKNVNIINVHNTTVINRNVTVNHFANHEAVTVVSRDAMTHSQHIAGAARHVDPRDLDRMHGYSGSHAPLAPTAQTVGLTPSEAKHFGLSQQIQQKPSAGPAIRENGARNWGRNVTGGQPNAPQAGQHQPGEQLNTLGRPQERNGAEQPQNNRWANRGSRKPGTPVQQPPQSQMNGQTRLDGPANASNPNRNPRFQNSEAGSNPAAQPNAPRQQNIPGQQNADVQNRQQKWDWANNRQSRQPGAPVQGREPAQSQRPVQGQGNIVEPTQQRVGQAVRKTPAQSQGEQKWQNQVHQQGNPQAREQPQYQQRQHNQQQQQQERAAQQQQLQHQQRQQFIQQQQQQQFMQQQQQQRAAQSRQPQQQGGGQQQEHADQHGRDNRPQQPQVLQPQN